MNKTKQIGIIIILVLVIASFVLAPLFKGSNSNESLTNTAAKFSFETDLETSLNRTIPIKFEIISADLKEIKLAVNDSIVNIWKKPTGKIEYKLNPNSFGVGIKTLNLIYTNSEGIENVDSRLIRILSDISPKKLKANILTTYSHNLNHFTQGLEFNDGKLYESTGLNGESKIAQISLNQDKPVLEKSIDSEYFGEGITILNNELYQITWQNQTCFIYDKNTFELKKKISYTGEGWGLCNNGEHIIMSNGSSQLTFRNPETFQIERTIDVYDNVGERMKLNELEYINGKIFANVWMLDIILEIDPQTGKVLSEIDCSEVVSKGQGSGEVLNGIAYNSKTNKIYLTGKKWAKLLEVKFE